MLFVAKAEPVVEVAKPTPAVVRQKKKMSYAEKKEWETIDADIEKMETDIEATESAMMSAGADYDKLRELTATLDALNATYETLVERWSYLHCYYEEFLAVINAKGRTNQTKYARGN